MDGIKPCSTAVLMQCGGDDLPARHSRSTRPPASAMMDSCNKLLSNSVLAASPSRAPCADRISMCRKRAIASRGATRWHQACCMRARCQHGLCLRITIARPWPNQLPNLCAVTSIECLYGLFFCCAPVRGCLRNGKNMPCDGNEKKSTQGFHDGLIVRTG
jgi:hypothetical protein